MRKAAGKMENEVVPADKSKFRDSSVRLVPSHAWQRHWLTVTEFSVLMNRAPDTVHGWVRQGVLAEFGIPVYRVRGGRLHSGRVFIQNVY